MNREIKFRRAYFTADGSFSHFSEWGVNIKDAAFVGPATNNFAERYVDQQYTGLKDKDGVEIYEGDIIHASGNNADYKVVFGRYEYSDDSDTDDHCGFYLERLSDKFVEPMGQPQHWATVIGNIYENPDLLK